MHQNRHLSRYGNHKLDVFIADETNHIHEIIKTTYTQHLFT